MVLLHISDIHFKSPECLTPSLDPNVPYRRHMLHDIRNNISGLGSVSAILISGDIAFKGAKEEYQTAATWIGELCATVGCSHEQVYVVPGNHDVDRVTIKGRPDTQNVQAAIINASKATREGVFQQQIYHGQTAESLLAPIAEYNSFAAKYDCQVYFPERPKWVQELSINGDMKLQIHGLTSTFLSGVNGDDDTRDQLYLSPIQTVFDPREDVIHLVLCHHPPDWLVDQDDVRDAINGAVAVQMFGHKHRQRIEHDTTHVRYDAGAVNPDRTESACPPGYNIVVLSVEGEGTDRVLQVDSYLREWQSNPDRYRGRISACGEEVFRHTIPCPVEIRCSSGPDDDGNNCRRPSAAATSEPESVDRNRRAPVGQPVLRSLVFRFWNLRDSHQRDIVMKFNLLEPDESSIADAEKYRRALVRAGERGLLEDLADEIGNRERMAQ